MQEIKSIVPSVEAIILRTCWLEDDPNNSGGGLLVPKFLGSFRERTQTKLCMLSPSFVCPRSSFSCAEAKCTEKGKKCTSN
jgi:hypothetical protein